MKRNALKTTASIGGAIMLACLASWIWRRYGPATYLRFRTMFGRTRVYQVQDDSGEPVRLLEVGGIVQSGTYLDERYADLVFEYLKRYNLMFASDRAIKRVCVLGCGGYDYPEHLIARHDDVMVDAVEIDPAITEIARCYFFLDRLIAEYDTESTGRLNLITADALAYLRSCPHRYDAIVNDTFDAGTPPEHLTTLEFIQTAHDHLSPGGLFLTNIVSPLEGPSAVFLHQQVALLKQTFAHTYLFPCIEDAYEGASVETDNIVVVATDSPLPDKLSDHWV